MLGGARPSHMLGTPCSRRLTGFPHGYGTRPRRNDFIMSANTNTNLASEFYVASQLFRCGYTVTLTLGNTKEIDLIVTDGTKVLTIDVKGLKNMTNWPLTLIAEPRQNHFFVLVAWKNKFEKIGDIDSVPDVYIIPATKIREVLTPWAGRPNVTCVAYRNIKNSEYKNAWKSLFKN